MQVICTDGTVLQCDQFEAIDSGVLLFEERQRTEAGEEEEAEAEVEMDDQASAFVPLHQLRFVLPDGVQPDRASGRGTGQQTPQPATGAPPTGTAPPQGQMPPQQSSSQPPTQQGGQYQPSSQPGQGRR